MTPTYYRPRYAPMIWGVVIALALAAALVFAHRATVAVAVAAERAAVLADGASLLALSQAHSAAIRRERDSLRAVVARVDTVLVSRLRTVRDTAWLPADTSPVVRLASCRAQLDTLATDCERFRATATAALANADSLRRADSTAAHAQAVITAGITRSRDAALSQLAARGKRRSFERGVCVASGLLNVLQWRFR
jgi:hypothetical protein